MNCVRKTFTYLSSLLIDDVLSFDTEAILERVVSFFTELFTNQDQGTYDDSALGDFILPLIDQDDNDSLFCLPIVDKVKRATFDMETSSAPGLDDFGGTFYHTCWDIIALNVIEAVIYFFTTMLIPFGLNSSFVTLIPKKSGANRVEDFRPIFMAYGSLLGQLYNPYKSKVYFGSVITRRVKNAILRTIGISEGSLYFSYLGVPIFYGALPTCHLAAMTDSIIAKFNKWKGHSSLAGRKCMANSVIAALLVHSMMVYFWLRSLLKTVETAMRNFLWKGDISKKNTSCSVSWARCCSPIDEGGLGIRSLRLTNESYVCKLAWDILCNTSSAFSLIHSHYFTPRGRPQT
ncbi:hypothetical protein ACS0TY_030522 [Phlomoides rotata]